MVPPVDIVPPAGLLPPGETAARAAGVIPAAPPVPAPSAIPPEQIEALVGKPLSVSGDTGSRTARSGADLRDLFELAADLRNKQKPNPQGGRRSAWRQNGIAKAIPPGTV